MTLPTTVTDVEPDTGPSNVFAASMATPLDSLDPVFARGVSLLALYVNTYGGVPPGTTKYRGFALGKWYAEIQRRPGALSEFERATLLSVPSVTLNDYSRRVVPPTSGRGRDRERAWARVYLWACNRQEDEQG